MIAADVALVVADVDQAGRPKKRHPVPNPGWPSTQNQTHHRTAEKAGAT
jgi:hypothetical protein